MFLRTLVSAVMNLRVPWNAGNFLTSCKPVSCSGRTLHHGVSNHLCSYIPHALYFYCTVLYFRIFSASFLITFLFPEITTSISIHVPFSLSRIIMSGLMLVIVLSVWTCWFYNMVPLPPWLVSTDFRTCSYQCFCPIVPLFPCICWSVVVHTLYHVFLCKVLLPVLGMLILRCLLSRHIVGKVCTCYLYLSSIVLSHNISFCYYYCYCCCYYWCLTKSAIHQTLLEWSNDGYGIQHTWEKGWEELKFQNVTEILNNSIPTCINWVAECKLKSRTGSIGQCIAEFHTSRIT